jgi:hypothetical protein
VTYSIESSVTHRLQAAVRAVLPRSVSLRVRGGDSVFDFFLNGTAIEAKWLGEGGLRQVREVLAHKRHRPNIVVARRLSPGAREALSQAGVGWVDESGAAEIALGSIIVAKSGHPDPTPEKPSRWTPAVLAVAEALLYGRKGTVLAMQEATDLSSGSCTKALGVLTRLGLLASSASRGRGSARHVVDANRLLDEYATAAAAMPAAPSVRVGVTWREIPADVAEVGKQWKKAGVDWALTGAAAASLIAPYLTSVTTAEAYVDAKTVASLHAVAESVGLRPIEGGRLTLRPFPTVTTQLLAEDSNGLRVAPWPRVYVDLRAAGVRGEEAAEHLRELRHGR